jgi:predicted TIM-barrel fold metal-dependent hydrolase
MQRACIRAYNDWILEFSSDSHGRLVPVALMPSTGLGDAVAEVEWAIDHGFRSVLITSFPNGSAVADPSDDRLWSLLADARIPAAIHIGSFLEEGRVDRTVRDAPVLAAAMSASRSGRDAMQVALTFVFSGIFHRFPTLKLALVESNIGWMPALMEQADNIFLRTRFMTGLAESVPELPSRILYRNIAATFMLDTVGVENRHRLNGRHLMWSTDYPHSSTDWPNSRVTIERNFRGVPGDEVRRFLFENARDFYRLDGLSEWNDRKALVEAR